MLYKDAKPGHDLSFSYRTVDTAITEDLQTAFPVKGVEIYNITRDKQTSFQITVAHYQDEQDEPRQAIVFPKTKDTQFAQNIESIRGLAWNSAAQTLIKHSDKNTIFLTWWDNAQRLHLMTGRTSWAWSPLAEAFPKQDVQNVWQAISGGFDHDSNRLKQMADWLAMDADQALKQIKAALPSDRQAYFLVTVEDLARLKEIASLSGQNLAFETRVFFSTDNMHSQIAQVKQWAKQDSTGSYMVHSVPGVGVRAWRIKDKQTEKSLLARILPFSHALEQPLDGVDLVYQSGRGGYLTIYRLNS
jgi:hydroxylamine oxidation protein HaoB